MMMMMILDVSFININARGKLIVKFETVGKWYQMFYDRVSTAAHELRPTM
jgi:hypothetical protein